MVYLLSQEPVTFQSSSATDPNTSQNLTFVLRVAAGIGDALEGPATQQDLTLASQQATAIGDLLGFATPEVQALTLSQEAESSSGTALEVIGSEQTLSLTIEGELGLVTDTATPNTLALSLAQQGELAVHNDVAFPETLSLGLTQEVPSTRLAYRLQQFSATAVSSVGGGLETAVLTFSQQATFAFGNVNTLLLTLEQGEVGFPQSDVTVLPEVLGRQLTQQVSALAFASSTLLPDAKVLSLSQPPVILETINVVIVRSTDNPTDPSPTHARITPAHFMFEVWTSTTNFSGDIKRARIEWDMGDPSLGNHNIPTGPLVGVFYETVGQKTVSVRVTDIDGNVGTAQTTVEVLAVPALDLDIHVSSSTGNDTTGNGSIGSPYASWGHAMNTVVQGAWPLNTSRNIRVRWKRGDVFTAGGGFSVHPRQSGLLIIEAYDVGVDPVVETTTSAFAVFTADLQAISLRWRGLSINGKARYNIDGGGAVLPQDSPGQSGFVVSQVDQFGAPPGRDYDTETCDWVIQDMVVEGFRVGMEIKIGESFSPLYNPPIGEWKVLREFGLKNVTIRDNHTNNCFWDPMQWYSLIDCEVSRAYLSHSHRTRFWKFVYFKDTLLADASWGTGTRLCLKAHASRDFPTAESKYMVLSGVTFRGGGWTTDIGPRDPNAAGPDESTSDVLIEKCLWLPALSTSAAQSTQYLLFYGTDRVLVRNCRFVSSGAAPITISGVTPGQTWSDDVTIESCSVYGTGGGRILNLQSDDFCSNIRIFNCVSSVPNSGSTFVNITGGNSQSSITEMDGNCYNYNGSTNWVGDHGSTLSLAAWKVAHPTFDTLSFHGDPLYVDVSSPFLDGGNLHLQSGSPCIDAGYPSVADGVLDDIDGALRFSPFDIGVDETTTSIQSTLSLTLAPFQVAASGVVVGVVITKSTSSTRLLPAHFSFDASGSGVAAGLLSEAKVEWDFGDPGSHYNTARGIVGGHIFATAGTKTVTCTITDSFGNILTGQTTVDPVAVGSFAVDLYVSSSGSDGNNGLSPSTPFQTWDQAVSTLSWVDGGNHRINLRNGDVFTTAVSITAANDSLFASQPNQGTGYLYIGGYGGSSTTRPRINYTGAGNLVNLIKEKQHLRWDGVDASSQYDIVIDNSGVTGTCLNAVTNVSRVVAGNTPDWVVQNSEFYGWSHGINWENINAVADNDKDVPGELWLHHEELALQNVVIRDNADLGWEGPVQWGTVINCTISRVHDTHCWRSDWFRFLYIDRCTFDTPWFDQPEIATGGQAFTACSIETQGGAALPSRWLNVQESTFQGGKYPIVISPTNDTDNSFVSDVFFDRCEFHSTDPAIPQTPPTEALIKLRARNVYIQNSWFFGQDPDARFPASLDTNAVLLDSLPASPVPEIDTIHLLNCSMWGKTVGTEEGQGAFLFMSGNSTSTSITNVRLVNNALQIKDNTNITFFIKTTGAVTAASFSQCDNNLSHSVDGAASWASINAITQPLVVWQGATNFDLSSLQSDPDFRDPDSGRDLHILSTSPCIEAGIDLVAAEVQVDFDGFPRPTPFDIGSDYITGLASLGQLSITQPTALGAGTVIDADAFPGVLALTLSIVSTNAFTDLDGFVIVESQSLSLSQEAETSSSAGTVFEATQTLSTTSFQVSALLDGDAATNPDTVFLALVQEAEQAFTPDGKATPDVSSLAMNTFLHRAGNPLQVIQQSISDIFADALEVPSTLSLTLSQDEAFGFTLGDATAQLQSLTLSQPVPTLQSDALLPPRSLLSLDLTQQVSALGFGDALFDVTSPQLLTLSQEEESGGSTVTISDALSLLLEKQAVQVGGGLGVETSTKLLFLLREIAVALSDSAPVPNDQALTLGQQQAAAFDAGSGDATIPLNPIVLALSVETPALSSVVLYSVGAELTLTLAEQSATAQDLVSGSVSPLDSALALSQETPTLSSDVDPGAQTTQVLGLSTLSPTVFVIADVLPATQALTLAEQSATAAGTSVGTATPFTQSLTLSQEAPLLSIFSLVQTSQLSVDTSIFTAGFGIKATPSTLLVEFIRVPVEVVAFATVPPVLPPLASDRFEDELFLDPDTREDLWPIAQELSGSHEWRVTRWAPFTDILGQPE